MAQANYRFEKRQKELKKQQRKLEKAKRKAEMKDASGSATQEPKIANVDTIPVK
jgi:hypothetical protein